MSTSSQNPEGPSARDQYISGLREFADWLERNPGAEYPLDDRLLLPLTTNTAVVEFAAEHQLDVTIDKDGNASCSLQFGGITYRAYGYEDFAAQCEKSDEERARRWASKRGMEIVPSSDSETGGAK